MPGPLTYAAVTLLARDRIGQIRRALTAKTNAGPPNELDRHMLYLATEAERMMNASQPVIEPPMRLYGPPLTDHVSRFTLLGAIGPDLPRFAAYFAPGQRWLFDTLHKGTPDDDRERVLVNSTNLVFDFWKRVGPLIDGDISDAAKRAEAKQKMQAYALGHLCHVAADILVHPYFESLESRPVNPPTVPRVMSRDDVAGAFDVRIAQQFFARDTDTHNKKWADWFPTPGDVPGAFAKAMAASIEGLYGARAQGFPAFEEDFAKISPPPPPLSADLINEAIHNFRNIIEIERVWDYADWLGATIWMFLPMALAPIGAFKLTRANNLSVTLPADQEDVRRYESIVYPLAAASTVPLVAMILVSINGRGLRFEGITGWIQAALSIVGLIGFFATLGGAGSARWGLWFWTPLGLAVIQAVIAIARGSKENIRKFLWIGPVMQIVIAGAFMLAYRAFVHTGVELAQKEGDRTVVEDIEMLGAFLGWLAVVIVVWLLNAAFCRKLFSASVPEDQDAFQNGDPSQFLRLYDDVALVHDLGKAADSEHLADLSYPPARRPMLKFWFSLGLASPVHVRVEKDRLTFRFALPTSSPRTVFAPLAPITIEHWAAVLAAVVTGDGSDGALHTKPARDDEKGIELSAGLIFSDVGDDTSATKPAVDADGFSEVGATEDTAFVLYHTPRPRLAERMGRDGAAPDGARTLQEGKTGSQLQAVGGATPTQYHATDATDGTHPLLQTMFARGDVLEIASVPPAHRVVERVLNDTDVVLSSAFPAALVGGGVAYRRLASDRGAALQPNISVRVPPLSQGVGPNDVQATVPTQTFGDSFMVGDVVQVGTGVVQHRTVVAIKDGALVGLPAAPTGTPPGTLAAVNLMELDAPAISTASPFLIQRLSDADAAGFQLLADPNDVFGDGVTVMNDAADLAALLCLGAASRLTIADAPVTPPGAARPVARVSQVFRNWNLDRRRVNEWKMMVSGGAESERRGDYRAAEEAASVDAADANAVFTDAFVAGRRSAEATVLDKGWLGVFRSWVDMASRARTNTSDTQVFRPGEVSNRDLSRAMAYLIDAAEGVAP
jgi:hypothetical protein